MSVPKKTSDLAVIMLIGTGALFLLWNTWSFAPSLLPGYPGDAFFPRIVLAFILLCVAIIIFQAYRAHRKEAGAGWIHIDVRGLVIAVCFTTAYVFLLAAIGFEVATFLFLVGLLTARLQATGVRAWVTAGLVSAAATMVLYVCFVLLLGVDMPLLFLPQYLDI